MHTVTETRKLCSVFGAAEWVIFGVLDEVLSLGWKSVMCKVFSATGQYFSLKRSRMMCIGFVSV